MNWKSTVLLGGFSMLASAHYGIIAGWRMVSCEGLVFLAMVAIALLVGARVSLSRPL